MNMNDNISILTFNCQGLAGLQKRKDVLNFLKQKSFSIYCLQDTHWTKSEENYIRTMWGYECFFNSFNSQSRGTAILFNNNFEFKVNRSRKDNDGNKIIGKVL
jgi:exonuclease III